MTTMAKVLAAATKRAMATVTTQAMTTVMRVVGTYFSLLLKIILTSVFLDVTSQAAIYYE
jgi:hypothetical protein